MEPTSLSETSQSQGLILAEEILVGALLHPVLLLFAGGKKEWHRAMARVVLR